MFRITSMSTAERQTALAAVLVASLAPALQAQTQLASTTTGTTDSVTSVVQAVRRATARFVDIDAAKAAGWNAQITECMETDAGAMGYHYGNPALLGDSAVLEPTQPEALLYEPQSDGTMKFVAVEYLIPATAWTSDTPPTLFGRAFQFNEQFQVWGLHLWLRDNPSGTFAPWNPSVSCQFAG